VPRFHVPPEQIRGKGFVLLGSEARHAALVLRKKIGDTLDLFDGKDLSFHGRIDSVAPERIEGTILSQTQADHSSLVRLTLCQALIKGPRWDWLVEKACEIGVATLIPLLTARTVVKPSRAAALDRWKRIALAASKQCGRSDVMEITEPKPFAEVVNDLPKDGVALIPWEKEAIKTIHQAFQGHPSPTPSPLGEGRGTSEARGEGSQPISLLIGPEGGWDSQEVESAIRHGVIPVHLGPTLLRSETAGLVAATLVFRELGAYS
jgi:16S rRNA (uracil1498-N3)-methyltransferase